MNVFIVVTSLLNLVNAFLIFSQIIIIIINSIFIWRRLHCIKLISDETVKAIIAQWLSSIKDTRRV